MHSSTINLFPLFFYVCLLPDPSSLWRPTNRRTTNRVRIFSSTVYSAPIKRYPILIEKERGIVRDPLFVRISDLDF